MRVQLVQDRNAWVLWAEDGTYRTYSLQDYERAKADAAEKEREKFIHSGD